MSLTRPVDVLVVGGGVAGVCAAVAAAREGASTVIVERNGFFGGAATAAAVAQFMGWQTQGGTPLIRGIAQEIVDRLVAAGGSAGLDIGTLSTGTKMDRVVFDPDILKVVFDELVLDAGVTVLFYAMVSSVERRGRAIQSVGVLCKSGEVTFLPKAVVDSSGDLEVLLRADCEMLPLEEGEELQPASMSFRMGPADLGPYDAMTADERMVIAKRGVAEGALGRLAVSCYAVPGTTDAWFNVTRLAVDGTDAFALSTAEMQGRSQALKAARFIAKNLPGFEKARLNGFAPNLGIRETRRVRGHVVVTEQDLRTGRVFPDAIALGAFPIDVHQTKGVDTRIERVGGADHRYSIPLRSLIPISLDNALVAGRGISATHVAFGALRIMPQAMATGQAAGVAAALAVKGNAPPVELPFEKIRTVLQDGDVILPG